MTTYFFVLTVALIAGALSGIIGTGSSIMLLPVLVFQFGTKRSGMRRAAVPVSVSTAPMPRQRRR